ncbi:MAG: DUF1491 family protein [Alphaproteobacteria bacterium]|jgi:hypothetical protein|nr:hypothetical protein [Rhodospirillaceae bacterium]MDP6021873.1 DUF1491 family protein [Alphaproteobacteria bacterium]MDP6256953.1 DUF1491 family protein [Alphaproteobacteria bacterium]MDP7054364.1 DUF1491 family protein [Alphaproteobacteria bacterium]MDP7230879.1 DUF1491 family protein [Alphaproteobacteria bacterium]|tara:strand:- start:5729 stop:6103 length:375 start_codon:yes stop_codon:yes gene_type:complete
MQPRLATELWVKAHIRKCGLQAIPAMVVRHGDNTAGAIFIKVNHLGPGCMVLAPASSMDSSNLDGGRKWRRALGDERGDERGDALVAEVEADAYMARQLNMDPDLWLLEIEDREGRHLLEDILD